MDTATFVNPWIRMSEVARMLNRSRDTVRRMIKRRDLHGRQVHGQWEIYRASLEAFIAKDAPREVSGVVVEEDTLGLYCERGR